MSRTVFATKTIYMYIYIYIFELNCTHTHTHTYTQLVFVYKYTHILYMMVWSRHTGARNTSHTNGKKETKTVHNLLYTCSRTNGINSAYYQYWSPVITRRRRERVYRRQRADSKST